LLTFDSTTTTTTLYPWRQVEEEQAARYRAICRHFDDNVRYAIQGNHQAAFLAADQGFILVQELYYDLLNPADRFVSETAGDRLLDLVRFCFSQDSKVGNTTWLRCSNSVSGVWTSWDADGPQRNWMVKRGEYLLFDLAWVCGLINHSSPRLRAFMVGALNFLAEFSFRQTQRAILAQSSGSHAGSWWRCDQRALAELSMQIRHADPFVRDAALDARADKEIREAWIEKLTGAQ
jgi:hypothetical protein